MAAWKPKREGAQHPELHEVDEAIRDFKRAEARASGAAGDTAARRRRRRIVARLVAAATLVLILLIAVPPFRYPVEGTVSSSFFLRRRPESRLFFDIEMHRGLDLAAPTGTPVVATRSGRIVRVDEHPAYGNLVVLRHLFGFETYYAHLARVRVREGSLVLRGRPVGAVGETGRATGPHLHFEVRAADRSLPPGLFLLFHDVRRLVIGR